MKTKLIALALFTATAATVALYPAYQSAGAAAPRTPPVVHPIVNERAKIEVVFVLDTTGSMSDLIEAAKEKIWSIASTMASAQQAPEVKMGLVAYRDRGDDYVTKRVDLSSDLDTMYATLMDFQANGGGDTPESVNQALYEAVHNMSWSDDQSTYKVIFLVGDAPPHMDYANDVKFPQTMSFAIIKGISVNTIQSGQNDPTTRYWEQVAQLGNGQYFQVDQAGSAVAIATPFDKKLAELSAALDETKLYYGDEDAKLKQRIKMEATDKLNEKSSVSSRARRAVFNASESGTTNFLGDGELVEDISSGRIDLHTIAPAALPESLQSMSAEAQQSLIKDKADRRGELKRQVEQLAQQREVYLKEEVAKSGGAGDSLDDQIYGAIRIQAGKKGFSYEAESPAY